MSAAPSDEVRGFYVMHESYYAASMVGPDGKPERLVMIGRYGIGGGTKGEFAVREHKVVRHQPWLRLECFDEAWPVLAAWPDLVNLLASLAPPMGIRPNRQYPTFAKLTEGLLALGFVDLTQRKAPDAQA